MGGLHFSADRHLPQPRETFVQKVRALIHLLEGERKLLHQGTLQPQTQIAPAAAHSISVVIGGDVEASDECGGAIYHQQLAVVTNAQALECQRVELSHLPANLS